MKSNLVFTCFRIGFQCESYDKADHGITVC